MARQSGYILITGTIKDHTYYQMNGIHYVRKKSSLSRKTVLEGAQYEKTRMHANQLADASRIASKLYERIDASEKNMKLFRAMVGKAKTLLASGNDKEAVLEMMVKELEL